MKILLSLVLLFTSQLSFGFEIKFIGACSEEAEFSTNLAFKKGMNVGDISLNVLEAHNIPYQGTSAGLNQVFNTPIGLDSMEIISDKEMMAYGWCFEIDGVVPEVWANLVPIKSSTKLITWFYGYAHFLNGEWISQCEKSYLRRSPQLCPN